MRRVVTRFSQVKKAMAGAKNPRGVSLTPSTAPSRKANLDRCCGEGWEVASVLQKPSSIGDPDLWATDFFGPRFLEGLNLRPKSQGVSSNWSNLFGSCNSQKFLKKK